MRHWLRRHLPSMFHRRLLLLSAVMIAVTAGLTVQAARLTLGPAHGEARRVAESVLRDTRIVPTVRGRILDRHGAVLAVDEPGWDIAVDYRVLTGEWAETQAERAAIRVLGGGDFRAGRTRWRELSAQEQGQQVARMLPVYQQQVEQMWETLAGITGVDRERVDRRAASIVRRYQLQQAIVIEHQRRRRAEQLQIDVGWADAYTELREQRQRHAVVIDVSEPARLQVETFVAAAQRAINERDDDSVELVWLQVAPIVSRHRRYPFEAVTLMLDPAGLPRPLARAEPIEMTVEGVARHVLGALRPIHAGDASLTDRPFSSGELAGYDDGDLIGGSGAEAGMETTLRGRRGREVVRRDTGELVEQAAPIPGQDLTLTIDHRLQARVQAIMSHDERVGLMHAQPWHHGQLPAGTPLNGAAVVLDAETSEVLAAVSVPGMSLDTLRHDPQTIFGDFTYEPFVNRAVAYPYAPGSTMKPITLATAVSQRTVPGDWHFTCIGFHDWNNDGLWQSGGAGREPQCWIFKTFGQTHGNQSPAEAIKTSCNPYFFKLGELLGPRGFVEGVRTFGLGATHGCGLPEERPGILPDPATLRTADAVLMSIGQGQINWTPLQAVGAYAAIVRGGLYVPPTFVRGHHGEPRDLRLPDIAVTQVLDGMRRSANERGGTTNTLSYPAEMNTPAERIFNAPGVRVYAKSGTAQAPDLHERFDTDGDGIADARGELVARGDHAWVVALVGGEREPRPRYVIAAVVEYGGSGGRTAGPIANQIIRARQAEGYLPRGVETREPANLPADTHTE